MTFASHPVAACPHVIFTLRLFRHIIIHHHYSTPIHSSLLMRLLRNVLSNFTRRRYAQVHDVQVKYVDGTGKAAAQGFNEAKTMSEKNGKRARRSSCVSGDPVFLRSYAHASLLRIVRAPLFCVCFCLPGTSCLEGVPQYE